MTKSQLLYKLEEARNQYGLARERKDTETMRNLVKIARDYKLRLKYCICMWCKDNEKNLKLWPFCSKYCSDSYEQSRKRTLIETKPSKQMDEEFQKRMARIPEILAFLHQKQAEILPIKGTEWRHE